MSDCCVCMNSLHSLCVRVYVCVSCVHMSLAGNRGMYSFPSKPCWVRSGVYNYTWVPISSLRAFFSGSNNNTSSCTHRAQPAGSHITRPSTGYVQSCIIILTISHWLCGWIHESAQTNSWSLMYSPPLCFQDGREQAIAKPGMSQSFTQWHK